MKRTAALVSLTVVALCSLRTWAQGTPDFSGTWTLDTSKSQIRVGSTGPFSFDADITEPKLIKRVNPKYPAGAYSAHVAGVVIVEAVIGTDGSVQDAGIVGSVAPLDQAALDAVRQWKYTPVLLNDVPVEVLFSVTVTFALAGYLGEAAPTRPTAEPQVTITQDARSLTMTRDTPSGPQITVYRLDGTESRNLEPVHHGAGATHGSVSRSHWEGAKLVTTITSQGTRDPVVTDKMEQTETRYLAGAYMFVDLLSHSQAGRSWSRAERRVYAKAGK